MEKPPIYFDLDGFSAIENGCVIYPATVGYSFVRAGITSDAFLKVWGRFPDPGTNISLLEGWDPVHGEVKDEIRRKYEVEGLDAQGAVIVTEEDIL